MKLRYWLDANLMFWVHNRNVSIGIQERGNIRQGGLSLMQYLRSGSCSWQGWPRSSGLGCPGGACNEPGMPAAGGMGPPAMANASILASSHTFKFHNWVSDDSSNSHSKILQSLQHGNRTESLQLQLLIYVSSFLQADLQASPRRWQPNPHQLKLSNRSCSQGDIITVKGQLFMSLETEINESITSHAQETPHYSISAAYKAGLQSNTN